MESKVFVPPSWHKSDRAFRAEIVDPAGRFVGQLQVTDGAVDKSALFNPNRAASPNIVRVTQLDDNNKPSRTYWHHNSVNWEGPYSEPRLLTWTVSVLQEHQYSPAISVDEFGPYGTYEEALEVGLQQREEQAEAWHAIDADTEDFDPSRDEPWEATVTINAVRSDSSGVGVQNITETRYQPNQSFVSSGLLVREHDPQHLDLSL